MLKVSVFYFEKKGYIPKKNLSRCQYQNKKALFTDPIFSEDFDIIPLWMPYDMGKIKIKPTHER